MNQLKSLYNILFGDSYSHPVHTCLSMIVSNENVTRSIYINCNKEDKLTIEHILSNNFDFVQI